MANTMCPQDYVNLTREFLTCTFRSLLPFTADTVTKYCIKKTPELDPGDEKIIKHIVTETLEMYHGKKLIRQVRNTYHKRGLFAEIEIYNAEGYVLDDPKPMAPLTKEMVDKLNTIESRSHFDRDPFCSMDESVSEKE